MTVSPPNRPWRLVVAPMLLATTAGLGLLGALSPLVVLAGGAAGLVTGAAAGWSLTVATAGRASRGRAVLIIASTAGAIVAVMAAPALATADLGAVIRLREIVGGFLTVALPARGLRDLGAVVAVVVAITVAAAVWAALRARPLIVVGASLLGLAISAILAGSARPPGWVAVVVLALVGLVLLGESRTYYTDLPPLVGTSTAVRRPLPWWRPALVGLIAVGAAGGLAMMPSRATVDLRRHVDPDDVTLADANPLATVARLRIDPPPAAQGVDVVVAVEGPSPGALRLAVFDEYRAEGWVQSASFAVTGEVLPVPAVAGIDDGFGVEMHVVDGPAESGLRAMPTAGVPYEVTDPVTVRYAADAGVLIAPGENEVRYATRPTAATAPPGALGPPVGLPAALYDCPAGSIMESFGQTLAEGTSSSLERLRRVEGLLKLDRIYDPEGPGGQTLGSIEQFVAQRYARGNLETFVTAYALLARCAGVPVRVVVGYPAPPADTATEYRVEELAAWVETPIDEVGWIALDVVPTPAEQQRQAELAAEPPQDPEPPPPPPAPQDLTQVEATSPDRANLGRTAASIGLIVLAAAVAAVAVSWWIHAAAVRRRRRVADPAIATTLAWRSVLEAVRDRGIEVGPHLTARETARAAVGRVPGSVSRIMSELAGLADRAAFDAPQTTDADAGLAWGLATAALGRLPRSWRVRLAALRRPGRAWRRWRHAAGFPKRSSPWDAAVPASMLLDADDDVPMIPGCRLDARLGDGGTAAVYRGIDDEGRSVAVKVFHADLAASEVDRQRFEWEARVAGIVLGGDHLPVVYDAGIADGGRPYVVTTLYERGTLHRRIQRSGPLAPGEVAAAARQLAVALETLHQHGLFHGDVKPENVFVDDDGTLVLSDLGSAWLWADGGPSSAPTPPYAAPEVWMGHPPSVASDLFSLGLTLMYAASGRRPVAGSPPTVDEVREAFGSDVADALLDVDQRRRPRRAADVAVLFGADSDDVSATVRVRALPTPSFTATRTR